MYIQYYIYSIIHKFEPVVAPNLASWSLSLLESCNLLGTFITFHQQQIAIHLLSNIKVLLGTVVSFLFLFLKVSHARPNLLSRRCFHFKWNIYIYFIFLVRRWDGMHIVALLLGKQSSNNDVQFFYRNDILIVVLSVLIRWIIHNICILLHFIFVEEKLAWFIIL